MKNRWRRIFYVVMIINFIVGLVMTIVYTVRSGSFTTFLTNFMSTIIGTAFYALLLEFFSNVEKSLDSANRRAAGQPLLPDSAYSSTPAFIRNLFAGQQNAPAQQPAQPVQPVQQPAAPANDTWTCACGTVNASTAKFCKTCGKPKQ